MTIGSKQDSENNTLPEPGSSAYIDALLRQLPDEEKLRLLQKHTQESHPVLVEDKPENKLANINYQDYGLKYSEFHFVLEYFSNGYNATQAYLTVHPDVQWTSAKVGGHKVIHSPVVREFITACMNAMGMSNVELERRLEALIDADPLDAFDISENGKVVSFNANKARQMGISRRITSFKQTKFGVELGFVPVDRLMDIQTKVRGMQKKVSITKDLDIIAEGNDVEKSELMDMMDMLIEDVKPRLVAKFEHNGVEIYEDE